MQRFLALLFTLVTASAFGAAGDLKLTQRNPTDTGFIERTVAAQANALIAFSAGGLPTTIAPSALPVSAAMQTALDAKASSTHSHSAADITSGLLAADRLATGSALQVLRRNSANTALEFATISAGGGDMTRATYDANADNVVDSAAAVAWSGITSKPTTLSGYGITDAQPLDSDLTSIAALSTSSFGRSLLTQSDAAAARTTLGISDVWIIAISDESTALSAGTAKVTFRAPRAATVTAVRSSVGTASTSGLVTIDINEGGVSILSTVLTIDANEKTSTTAATAAVISDTSIADDAEITIDIDSAGTGAKGAKVAIYVTY